MSYTKSLLDAADQIVGKPEPKPAPKRIHDPRKDDRNKCFMISGVIAVLLFSWCFWLSEQEISMGQYKQLEADKKEFPELSTAYEMMDGIITYNERAEILSRTRLYREIKEKAEETDKQAKLAEQDNAKQAELNRIKDTLRTP